MSNYPTVPTPVSVLPDGTALPRHCMTLGASRGDTGTAHMIAERWHDTPQVKATLDILRDSQLEGPFFDSRWSTAPATRCGGSTPS